MILLQNLHTHSTFCDGRNTPEEIVRHALSLGMDSIGFSGHSPMFYSALYKTLLKNNEGYRKEIARLKEKYKGQIHILCGLEIDMFAAEGQASYDYVIGSFHYFRFGEEYVLFDSSKEAVAQIIDRYFGGDGLAYAKAYYESLATLPSLMKADIIGHFDLITKHSENASFFDEDSPIYRKYALEALVALVEKNPIMEVNTGAIARGYRTTPYPSPFLLKEWHARGGEIVISSDCHNQDFLLCAYEDAIALSRECGFDHSLVLGDHGFEAVSFDDLQKKLLKSKN